MAHLNPDRLADQALGDEEPLTAAEQDHLASCAACRDELAELSRIVNLGRQPEHIVPELVPANSIWESIQGQLASQAPAAATTGPAALTTEGGATESAPTSPTVVELPPRTPRRRSWLLVAAAAVLGLIIGAGVTVGVFRDRVEVTAVTSLEPLPGQVGQGTAELVSDQGRPELRVQIDAPATPDRYREVWLINTDGERMYSLGVLPNDGRATYPLPPALAGQLQDFTIVDVSIEPYDGNPAHSRDSQVRGVLPT
jgi:anti-sigma-K factor RskA